MPEQRNIGDEEEKLIGRVKTKGGVEQGKKEAILDLSIQVVYGFSIPQIVIEVRKKVGASLLEMAGLIAKEVNINITGIAFPERMPGKVE